MLAQIVLFDGFDLLDVIAPYEVFCAAGLYSGGALRAELVTAEGARTVPRNQRAEHSRRRKNRSSRCRSHSGPGVRIGKTE